MVKEVLNKTQELARLISEGDAVHDYQRWLAQEVGELTLKIPDLDKVPFSAIQLLVQMILMGDVSANKLVLTIDTDENNVQEWLDNLCEFSFAEETENGYKSTLVGQNVINALGKLMVNRELMVIKARLERLESVYQNMSEF